MIAIRHLLVVVTVAVVFAVAAIKAEAAGVTKSVFGGKTSTNSVTKTQGPGGSGSITLHHEGSATLGRTISTPLGTFGKAVTVSNDRDLTISRGADGSRSISFSGDHSTSVTKIRQTP